MPWLASPPVGGLTCRKSPSEPTYWAQASGAREICSERQLDYMTSATGLSLRFARFTHLTALGTSA